MPNNDTRELKTESCKSTLNQFQSMLDDFSRNTNSINSKQALIETLLKYLKQKFKLDIVIIH